MRKEVDELLKKGKTVIIISNPERIEIPAESRDRIVLVDYE